MPGDAYLPPVVVEFTGDATRFFRTLGEVKSALLGIETTDTEAPIGANTRQFQDRLALAKSELLALARDVTKAKIGADTVPFWSEIAALRETLDHLSPLDINVDANVAPALAQIEALRGTLASSQTGSLLDSFGASILGGLGGGESGGGGGGGGALKGLLSAMGWGGGQMGMASFGSLLSLMGFGAEHLSVTAIGIAGSILGGIIGGGLLGLGSLGVAGVGMGTDMAGLGQAYGDISKVEQAQSALNQAMVTYRYDVAHYGASSAVAAAALQNLQSAQANVNSTLSQVPAVARGAVLAAANTIQQFKTLFDQLTGPAEKLGANIIQQAVKVGEAFLPTIGKYAAANMGIIEKSLNSKGGLFSWLTNSGKTGGLGIFKNLEQIFTSDLPMGMHALTMGMELFAKTVDVAAQYTGPFLRAINNFLTKENTSGFSKWATEIGKLIGLFRAWLGLLITVGKTIFDVFKPAVGLGEDIAEGLTGLFHQIDAWLTKSSTQSTMHGLFSAHMAQVIKGIGGALAAALPFLEGFATAFMKAATVGADFVTPVLKGVAWLLNELGKIPFLKTIGGWVAVFLLARGSVVGLLTTLGNMIPLFGRFIASIAEMAAGLYVQVAAWLSDAAAATAAFVAENVATLGIAALIGILVGAVIYLATHWRQSWSDVKQWALDVYHFLDNDVFHPLVRFFTGELVPTVDLAERVWHTVWNDIRSVASDVWHFLDNDILHPIISFFTGVWHSTVSGVGTAWHDVWHGIQSAASAVWHFLDNDVFHPLVGFFTGVWHSTLSVVGKVWNTVWHGIQSVVQSVWTVISGIFHDISHAISDVIGGIGKMVGALTHAHFGGGVLSHIPLIGGLLSHIPFLAGGGLVTQPTLAVVGEAGPEAVLPLNQLGGASLTGGGIHALPALAGGGGPTITLTVNYTINAPGGNAQNIRGAVEGSAGHIVSALRAGAGGVYG